MSLAVLPLETEIDACFEFGHGESEAHAHAVLADVISTNYQVLLSGGENCEFVTREAEGCMNGIHHRMPLILHREEIESWLFSVVEAKKLLDRHFTELERQKSEMDGYQQMSLF